MNKTALIEQELRAAKGRIMGGFADGLHLDTSARFTTLIRSLESLGSEGDPELYRHFPVAAVAILESDFKAAVASIVNLGGEYLSRGLELTRDRFRSAVEVVPMIHRETVTVGELVAYALPFNSVASLEAVGKLLGKDLKGLCQSAANPHQVRTESSTPDLVVPDVEALWRDLSTTFQRRHILAHEAASKYEVSASDARASVEGCQRFTEALNAILWSTIWADEPLTQYEMNVRSWQDYLATRAALARRLKEGLAAATERAERDRFRRLHRQWKQFSESWATWELEPFAMGSIRPMLAAISRKQLAEFRLKSLESWLSRIQPEAYRQ
jgi:hypothetical protein